MPSASAATYTSVSANAGSSTTASVLSTPRATAIKQRVAEPSSAAAASNSSGTAAPSNNQVLFSDASIRYNDYLLDYCQTSMSALSGSAAGIMGLTGLSGFVFYFVCSLFLSLVILLYLGARVSKFFASKQAIVTGTLWSGLQTYLLFWTFMFGMVHVY